MQRVANIGVGKPGDETAMPAKLYTAESQADLKTAFSTILTDVPRSCVFSLNGRVKAENASEGTVVLNGQAGDKSSWWWRPARKSAPAKTSSTSISPVAFSCRSSDARSPSARAALESECHSPCPKW